MLDVSMLSARTMKMALAYVFVFITSFGITAIPLYTLKYLGLDLSLKIMVVLEFLLAILIYFFYFHGKDGFRNDSARIKVVVFYAGLLSIVQILLFLLQSRASIPPPSSFDILGVLALIIIVPFYEEVIYRGCVFSAVLYFLNGFWMPAIITAVVFTLMHSQYTSITSYIVIFFLSMVLTYVRVITKGLLYPMALHASMNATVVFLNIQTFYR